MATIDELKATISKTGVAKANQFDVDFVGMKDLGFPLSIEGTSKTELIRDLNKFVSSTSIPGRQLQTFGYDLFRHMTEFPTGYVNDSLAIEFILPSKLEVKQIFDAWINYVVDIDSYLMKFANQYKCDLVLSQMRRDREGVKKTYSVVITDCYPKAVRGVTYSQDDDSLTKFSVEFAFNDLHFPSVKTKFSPQVQGGRPEVVTP